MKIKPKTAALVLRALFLTMLASLFILASCSDSGDGLPSDGDDNGGIDLSKVYMVENRISVGGGIYKFNVFTGKSTHLCQDPLCEHEWRRTDRGYRADCNFSSVIGAVADGEWVYYIKNDETTFPPGTYFVQGDDVLPNLGYDTLQSICAYNCVTNQLNVLYKHTAPDNESTFPSGYIWHFDGYVYFELYSPEPENEDIIMYRLNVKTKEIEEMHRNAVRYSRFEMTKDHVFFHNWMEKTIYRTDHWGSNRIDLVKEWQDLSAPFALTDEYIYISIVRKADGGLAYDIYRVSIDGGEPELVVEEDVTTFSICIIDDYYYYYEYENLDFMTDFTIPPSFKPGIWRMKLDGSVERELIYEGFDVGDIAYATVFGQYIVLSLWGEVRGTVTSFGLLADQKLVYDTIAEKWLEYD